MDVALPSDRGDSGEDEPEDSFSGTVQTSSTAEDLLEAIEFPARAPLLFGQRGRGLLTGRSSAVKYS